MITDTRAQALQDLKDRLKQIVEIFGKRLFAGSKEPAWLLEEYGRLTNKLQEEESDGAH